MPEIEAFADDVKIMLEASRLAASIAMAHFRQDPEVWYKNEGRSPVSEADIAIDELLKKILLDARPDYGWLSEETRDTEHRLGRRRVFIVDPIDGTRAYVAGRPDWCVSVGLIEDGRPVAGVLAAPARGEMWHGRLGGGAFLNDVRLRSGQGDVPDAPLRVAVPDVVAAQMRPGAVAGLDKVAGAPSLALKVAAVAQGELDGVYIRPQSSEWDLAAADTLLGETGHTLVDKAGAPMIYNAPDPSRGLLLAAARQQAPGLLALLQPCDGH
ncbi:3'(2'),5'-bisphosphate nucleotidase CysQ [Hoeflea sp. YIM 152468]|uniref:3'(2'),5'-bisphosphate nucleotidase CysQ n=1 Tax=Hoeflea sp. YIM 152468 TaxID=3031759 RepID=UPI0023DC697C|nr:3'(2'),5'-bisphosphate nucleotidase CysQ [Hoeflea sp. YIM 152468]MDF1606772.1 3'(2'),5'-bisphosphate nucleotidase CysQ [Hoeflea sp. YIM 152468]